MIRYDTVQHITIQYDSVRYITIEYDIIQSDTICIRQELLTSDSPEVSTESQEEPGFHFFPAYDV